jgi:hypothetical protein
LLVFLLLVVGLLSPPAAAAAPNVTGAWIQPAIPSNPPFYLVSTNSGKRLTAGWRGSGAHATLVGEFTGTFDAAEDEYNGTFQVSEEDNPPVGGTMTFQIIPPQQLHVFYTQDNGVSGSFDLVRETTRPVAFNVGNLPEVEFGFNCSEQNECVGDAKCVQVITQYRNLRATGVRAALSRKKKVIVGSKRISVPPGQTTKVSVRLNKTGRRLLSRFGRLRVLVKLSLNPSSGLPPVTKVGKVTFHKKRR